MNRTPITFAVSRIVFDQGRQVAAHMLKGDSPYASIYMGHEITPEYLGDIIAGWRRIGYEPSFIFAPDVPPQWKAAFLDALWNESEAA